MSPRQSDRLAHIMRRFGPSGPPAQARALIIDAPPRWTVSGGPCEPVPPFRSRATVVL